MYAPLSWRRIAVAFLLCVLACGQAAQARVARPDALDRRVDAIASARLASLPATRLVDPDRQAAAAHLERLDLVGWFAMVLFQVILLLYFWRSGHAGRWRDLLRRRIRSEHLVRFVFGAGLAGLAALAALMPQFFLYRVARVMQLSDRLTIPWAQRWLLHTIALMLLAGIIATVILMLADRTHQWYLITIGGVYLAVLCGAFVQPFLDPSMGRAITPLHPALAGAVARLERRAGIGAIPVVVVDRSRKTQTDGARVVGLGPTMHIELGDTLVAGDPSPEVLFATARQLGHVAQNDPLRSALLLATLTVLATALAVFIADRVGFRRDDDPVSRLALVGALLGCAFILAVPVENAYRAHMAASADAYAVRLTGNRTAGERAMIRWADEGMELVCPDVMERLFLLPQPSIASRVAMLNGVSPRCP